MSKSLFNQVLLVLLIFTAFLFAAGSRAIAQEECTSTYGNGQTCVRNKNFFIEKKVRRLGEEGDWLDQVRISTDDRVEFRIVVKNTGAVEVNDFKVEDSLPEELVVFESNTGWEIDNFKPGDINTFILKARVYKEKISENQEKCVVNVVKGLLKDQTETSALATVCIKGPGEVLAAEKLPETAGLASVLGQLAIGLFLVGGGLALNRFSAAL